MQTKTTFKFLGATLLSLMLAACGGGDGSALDNTINNGISSSSSGFTGSQASSAASSIDALTLSNMGYGTGATFTAGAIGVGIGTNTLSAGGETSLTVNLVSATGTLITQNLSITFNSKCFAQKKATLSDTTVQTSSGEASITYAAKGCIGTDLVTATVSNGGKTYTAQVTLTVEADTIGSVKFVDATPTQISLSGTGGTETSTVRFQVLGSTGAPIEGSPVDFTLSTTQGGLYLTIPQGETKPTAKTDSAGYASIKVNAGAVSTTVRITATTATGLSTQSSVLTVSTGIPDQNSVSLAFTDIAPVSWRHDGIESIASIRLADAFNNPVPDGTAVSFTTSGGSIDPSCVTKGGVCTAKWTSQEPRPTSVTPFIVTNNLQIACPLPASGIPEECRSGRVQVLATAIGNESFVDQNGNGLYDGASVDGFTAPNDSNTSGPTKCSYNVPWSTAKIGAANSCDDLGEAYIDKNFNGIKDENEEFADFNVDKAFNTGNNKYNGVLCNSTDISVCDKKSVTVRQDATLVMASENVYLAGGRLPGQPTEETSIAAGDSKSLTMLLADENGNGMPAGTTVKVSTETASNVTATVSPKAALPASQEPTTITLFLKAADDATKKPSGAVVIEITAPSRDGSLTTSIGVPVCGPATEAPAPVTISNCN